MGSIGFPFVKVSEAAAAVLGEQSPGLRVYEYSAPESGFRVWYDAIAEYIGPVMTPGEVALYLGVTRPSVRKRIESAKLTAFVFKVQEDVTGDSGRRRMRETDIMYIPHAEVRAWDRERQARLEDAHREELRRVEEEKERYKQALEGLEAKLRREAEVKMIARELGITTAEVEEQGLTRADLNR